MNRIRFFRVKKAQPLSQFLQGQLQIDHQEAEFLIDFGAVYVNFLRTIKDLEIAPGDIVRCHTQPKRYLTAIDWSKHIVADEENFIVINKPAGIPCQPGLDNRLENILFQLSRFTQYDLFITHRLDIGTQGLMLLAKNKSFQSGFNRLLENRSVVKIYECLTLGPILEPGLLTHWMRPHPRSPKILSRQPVVNWKECQLEILASQNLVSTLPSPEAIFSRGINYYRLQLHTGRTHQIRAQLSFEQNPILGDSLYGGQSHQLPFEWQALQCSELAFRHADRDFHWSLPSLQPAELKSSLTSPAVPL